MKRNIEMTLDYLKEVLGTGIEYRMETGVMVINLHKTNLTPADARKIAVRMNQAFEVKFDGQFKVMEVMKIWNQDGEAMLVPCIAII